MKRFPVKEVHALIRGESLDKPTISDLLDEDKNSGSTPDIGKARMADPEPDNPYNLGGGELPAPG